MSICWENWNSTFLGNCQKVVDCFSDLASTFCPFLSFDYSTRYRNSVSLWKFLFAFVDLNSRIYQATLKAGSMYHHFYKGKLLREILFLHTHPTLYVEDITTYQSNKSLYWVINLNICWGWVPKGQPWKAWDCPASSWWRC